MNSSSKVPLIAAILVSLCAGFAASQWRASLSADELRGQIDELQSKAKQNSENVTNVTYRANLLDSYRQTLLALLEVNASQPDAARKHLHAAAELISDRHEEVISVLSKRAEELSKSPGTLQSTSVRALAQQFDDLMPRPMNQSS